jgi:hypothetical protein
MSGKVPSEEQGGTGVDYPGLQIQIRDTDAERAMSNSEVIRLALNDSIVGDYVVFTTRSCPSDVTSPEDLGATDGPLWRFSVDFETISVR